MELKQELRSLIDSLLHEAAFIKNSIAVTKVFDSHESKALEKISDRLMVWREDLEREVEALNTSPHSTDLVTRHLQKALLALADVKAEVGRAVEHEGLNQDTTNMRIVSLPRYDATVRRLIRLRRPPFDHTTVEDLEAYDQYLSTIVGTERAFAPLTFDHSIEAAHQDSETFVAYCDLPPGAELVTSSEAGPNVLSLAGSTASKREKIQHIFSDAMRDLTPLSMIHTTPHNGNHQGSQDFINELLKLYVSEDEKARNDDVFYLTFLHIQRLDAALAHIVAENSEHCTCNPESLLWGIFTKFLQAANRVPNPTILSARLLEPLVHHLPKMHWYPEMCGPLEEYELSIFVVQLFGHVIKYCDKALELFRRLDSKQSESEKMKQALADKDLGILAREMRIFSIEVDKAALKERLAAGAEMDEHHRQPNTRYAETLEEDLVKQGGEKDIDDDIDDSDADDADDAGDTSSASTDDLSEDDLYQRLRRRKALSTPSQSGPQAIQDAPESLLDEAFRGRRLELESLVDATYAQCANFTGRCVLYGPEPMGKSQIVLRYVKSLRLTSPDVSIFWIIASSPAAISESYGQILALLQDRAQNSNNHRQRMFAVKRHLERLDSRYGKSWLLVVDGLQAEAQEMLKGFLPTSSPRGRIVFTTSSTDVLQRLKIEAGAELIQIDVGKMEVQDAKEVLIASMGTKAAGYSSEWVGDVAKQLDYSPLPIRIVGGLLKRFRGLRADNIMDDCKEELEDREMLNLNDYLNQKPMVQAVLRFGINQICKYRPDLHALLRILAFFDTESIPFGPLAFEDFLRDDQTPPGSDTSKSIYERRRFSMSTIEKDDIKIQETTLEDSTVFFSAVVQESEASTSSIIHEVLKKLSDRASRQELGDQLLASSLVNKRSNVARLTLRIHDTVRQAILADLTEQGHFQEFYDVAVTLLVKALEKVGPSTQDTRTWRKCAILAPHFESLMRLLPQGGATQISFIKALSKMGQYLHSSGQYKKAIDYFEWCANYSESPESSQFLEFLARAHLKNDEFETADAIFARLLRRSADSSIELNDSNLETAEGLATTYYLRGWLCKARDLYHEVLARLQPMMPTASHQPSSYLLAKLNEGLGNTYQRLGEPKEAAQYYDKCSIHHREGLGDQTISHLRIRYNKARLLRDQGELAKAQAAFESILEDYSTSAGREHPDALLVSSRLAFTYAMLGKYEKAEQLALKTLSSQLAKEDRQWVAICYTHWVLAGIYTHTEIKTRRRAHAHFLLALEGYETHLGPGHLFTLYVRRDFSHLFQLQSRLDDAVELLEEVSSDLMQGSAAAAKLARLYDWQASVAKKDNKVEESSKKMKKAEDLAKKTLDIQRRTLGKYHTDFNYTLWVLARIYRNRGQPGDRKRAEEHYKNALIGYERIRGEVFDSLSGLREEYDNFKKGEVIKSPDTVMAQDAWSGGPEVPFGILDDHIDEEYREGGQYNESPNLVDGGSSPLGVKDILGSSLLVGPPTFNQQLPIAVFG